MVLATGAVEAMVVDVQCVMQSVAQVVKEMHTDIITTNYRAKMPDAIHIQFEEQDAMGSAKEILKKAIGNFKKRGVHYIPKDKKFDVVVGFSHETINYMLGGRFRGSYRPLNENIINGRIRGVAAIVGCEHYKYADDVHFKIATELIKNNVLVLATGCAASALGRRGLMRPEAAAEYAGAGLAEVCETVGMPPVLHVGSCVDNSRLLIALTEMVNAGGLGEDIGTSCLRYCTFIYVRESSCHWSVLCQFRSPCRIPESADKRCQKVQRISPWRDERIVRRQLGCRRRSYQVGPSHD